ncbi:hypothetical protein NA57DRAFT_64483 [Rhizodiscina lignyota]|uniref:Zn(2)-C6 fungal-type domain-containing protein n=1 Tax=Rhizodiscina lignyota TaxID=1504668 RepID=A0A9P4M961_9PEZI|nr:hypothetical protein NA57DRAFT_64483 [Rhizodiscina lignyota]
MVYCGKPSRGCQCCKTRRIKCDEARPACGNCKKSGRECPGYPDEFDLIFRNETSATKKRAQKASNRNRSNTSFSRSLFERAALDPKFPFFDIDCSSPSFWVSSIPAGLEYSVEAAATSFFFRNFVYLPLNSGSGRGYLEYLIPMYNQASSDSPLQLATHAVALSALGNYPGNSRLKVDARKAYGRALNKINEAIQDPLTAASDHSLMTILMFSLYEAVASTDKQPTAWSNHVDGAVALAKLRGSDGWKTKESVGLFRAIRMCMLTSAIQRAKPVDEYPGPKGWTCDDNFEQNPANRLAIISLDLPNLRRYAVDVVSQSPSLNKNAEIMHIMKMAQEVDGRLEHWYLTLPEDWGHRTVRMQLEEPVDVFNAPQWQGPVHIYDDLFMANIINDYRVSRIFCQQIILNMSGALSDPAPETLITVHGMQQHAMYVARTMADDVCSSVPFHLEIDLQPRARDSGQEIHAAEATGGYFLSWPLFVIGNTDCVPMRQREWIRGRLYRIGQDFGLSSAQMMTLAQKSVLTSGPSFP